jgi:hypothetical protein
MHKQSRNAVPTRHSRARYADHRNHHHEKFTNLRHRNNNNNNNNNNNTKSIFPVRTRIINPASQQNRTTTNNYSKKRKIKQHRRKSNVRGLMKRGGKKRVNIKKLFKWLQAAKSHNQPVVKQACIFSFLGKNVQEKETKNF